MYWKTVAIAMTFAAGIMGGYLVSTWTTRPALTPADELDYVMKEAYQAMMGDVAALWGMADMAMPARKVWVEYAEGMAARRIMDFEQGELRVERLLAPGEDEKQALDALRRAVREASQETPAEMAAHDQMLHYAEKIAKAQGLAMPQAPPGAAEREQAVLKDILPADAALQMSAERAMRKTVVGEDGKPRTMLSMRIPFSQGFHTTLAQRYAEHVLEQAERHGIAPSLILAIMQIESAFNPRAMSPAPAYGLMQLVPRTGGLDAYRFLYNERRILSPEYLYDPVNNIKLGVAYLKLLDSRYLRAVEHPQSRLYCAIAAYNTGAGNVARAFSGTTNVRNAASIINTLTPEQVFARLRAQLPFEETQRYLAKVTEARGNYLAWDGLAAR
jgi:membrane-bound lytic murein transglycosylase C